MFNLGYRIKELRKQKHMSQADLAESIGKRQESIARIENGKFNPSYDVLVDICNSLGVSLSEFFSSDTLPSDLQRWLQVGKKLSPEQRDALSKIIETLADDN
ncbi:helix-turn-helix transcriptional regulator [Thermoflavimicrobium daqui]|jgi:transcriptional regulator with XRE-family HTH domain|uniref:HTH cro/C1-type domain-containing protein n=1 Tax=Thermoflavimicrobium daqui TaxID=2137476 RepID=A0A364K0G0_9BACL|nr:helix-turn-helix transcriptional regulator [Thermoflavimicrobium daqui]RAL20831.1 hypothetical protein DL897_17690 [Thermoflavimicrobium daqui]